MPLRSKVIQNISSRLDLTEDQSEVVEYGYIAFTQILSTVLLVSVLGWLSGILWQSLVVLFLSSILRQFSGGAHASRPGICLLVGTSASLLFAFLAKLINRLGLSLAATAAIAAVCLVLSYVLVYKKAPVANPRKPISADKHKRMKKYSLITLTVYSTVASVLIILYGYTRNPNFAEYMFCILFGTIWQIFNLTLIGHRLLGKLDSVLNQILFRKGEKV